MIAIPLRLLPTTVWSCDECLAIHLVSISISQCSCKNQLLNHNTNITSYRTGPVDSRWSYQSLLAPTRDTLGYLCQPVIYWYSQHETYHINVNKWLQNNIYGYALSLI